MSYELLLDYYHIRQGGCVFVSVCWFVCQHDYSNSRGTRGWISMKFLDGVDSETINNRLDFVVTF